MPDRRLLLPGDVAGGNAFTCPGAVHVRLADLDRSRPSEVDDDGVPVVLVLPSLVQLLQAGWHDALGARGWATFGGWLAESLDESGRRPTWRYDAVVAAWADVVGPGRIHVVAGEDPVAASVTLARLRGTAEEATAARSWTRALSWAEVRMVESLVAELESLELVGRNAADMVHGGVEQLRRSDAVVPLGRSPLPAALADRVGAEGRAMLAALTSSGVHVVGDRAALGWPTDGGSAAGAVDLASAARLATGVLDRVAGWGSRGDMA